VESVLMEALRVEFGFGSANARRRLWGWIHASSSVEEKAFRRVIRNLPALDSGSRNTSARGATFGSPILQSGGTFALLPAPTSANSRTIPWGIVSVRPPASAGFSSKVFLILEADA
jgi:hypothetical protein